jgi:hypothetical protein
MARHSVRSESECQCLRVHLSLRQSARRIAQQEIASALDHQIEELEVQRNLATTDIGIAVRPRGEDYHIRVLKSSTAQRLHASILVERITACRDMDGAVTRHTRYDSMERSLYMVSICADAKEILWQNAGTLRSPAQLRSRARQV